jgi:hypothetical protein
VPEVVHGGRVLDVIEVGEMFGHASVLSGDLPLPAHRQHDASGEALPTGRCSWQSFLI